MELVIVSGKGGTGKTTIAAALSELAEKAVRVDCDVDASNLYLFYDGTDLEKADFYAGKKAVIDEDKCTKCGKCERTCKFNAVQNAKVDILACEGCGSCVLVCPQNAIRLEDEKAADTFITQLAGGIISRAEMEIGSDGSGKLVTFLRKKGRMFSDQYNLTIIDGSPGIGCPVIASITGSNAALVVTEPTKSGLEDLKRIVSLCNYFGTFIMVCINKFDINEEMTEEIQKYIKKQELTLVGMIPYDETVMRSVNELKPIIYYEKSTAGKAIINIWLSIKKLLFEEEKE